MNLLFIIKPVYDRSKKVYTVKAEITEPSNVSAAVNSGFYATDSGWASVLGRIVAKRCAWYDGLKPAAQKAVYEWLLENVR